MMPRDSKTNVLPLRHVIFLGSVQLRTKATALQQVVPNVCKHDGTAVVALPTQCHRMSLQHRLLMARQQKWSFGPFRRGLPFLPLQFGRETLPQPRCSSKHGDYEFLMDLSLLAQGPVHTLKGLLSFIFRPLFLCPTQPHLIQASPRFF